MHVRIISKLKKVSIKDIALITMFIDHANKILWIYNPLLYIIGRISMPLYAYSIAKGFNLTKDKYNYFLRILVLACVSEPIYDYVFYDLNVYTGNQNILFGYALALLLLIIDYEYKPRLMYKIPLYSFILILSEALKIDYGIGSVVSVVLFHKAYTTVLRRSQFNLMLLGALSPLLNSITILQLPSVAAIAPIQYLDRRKGVIPRKLFYVAYPLHLILLKLISSLIHTAT